MSNVNILSSSTIGNYTFSDTRLQTVLTASSVGQATKMGFLDSIIDWFNGGIKREAIEELFNQICDEREEASPQVVAERFGRLRGLAKEEYKSQFVMTVVENDRNWSLTLAIGTSTLAEFTERPYGDNCYHSVCDIKRMIDKDNELVEKTLQSHFNDLTEALSFNDQLESLQGKKSTFDAEKHSITDKDFSSGGVNKRFHKGVLKAINETGKQDFIRENQLATYIATKENKEELSRYTSLQKIIATPRGLDGRFTYATVDVYDNVESIELDGYFNKLKELEEGSKEERNSHISSLVTQLIDLQRCLYKANIQHRDLHMHNLLVHTVDGTPILKAIDFGKAKFGEANPDKLADIHYLFKKEALNPFETFSRNQLRSETSTKQMKHYPLHKLIALLKPNDSAATEKFLSKTADKLAANLSKAADDEQIDKAFYRCISDLQDYMSGTV